MYNLAIALLISLIVNIVLTALVGLQAWISSLIALAVFAGVYFLATRIVMKKVSGLMDTVQRDLQAGRSEKAIKLLESGMRYAPWQFFIKSQINAQIGTILFLKRDFAEAFEYLQKGMVRHWVAMGMLGVCYMKRNKIGKMIETFDKATSASKKEPMLWALYAYCLDKVGEHAKAIEALEKGLRRLGGKDENLQENLEYLKEGRKMKMKGFGEIWYQFHLESPGTLIKQQTKAIQGRRKIVRR
jgi:tetratricopeptide (TPR) repeat protein